MSGHRYRCKSIITKPLCHMDGLTLNQRFEGSSPSGGTAVRFRQETPRGVNLAFFFRRARAGRRNRDAWFDGGEGDRRRIAHSADVRRWRG